MPKNLFQNVIFTLMMSFLMVYVMICYNISLNIGGMSNEVFLMAFGEMKIMWPVAFFWQMFYCGPCIRFIFGKMFPEKKEATTSDVVAEQTDIKNVT